VLGAGLRPIFRYGYWFWYAWRRECCGAHQGYGPVYASLTEGLAMPRNNLSRSLHDVGLAAWFGGTLANAVALNPAAGGAGTATSTSAVANAGWDRWTPVNAGAIGLPWRAALVSWRGSNGPSPH